MRLRVNPPSTSYSFTHLANGHGVKLCPCENPFFSKNVSLRQGTLVFVKAPED